MRLATFEIISGLIPIEGKDRIELAKVLEYEVVVKKGEFKVGDWCVYVFIDTIVDIKQEHFKFLGNGKKTKGDSMRIKTCKFGDVYSQGLCLPLINFIDIPNPDTLSEDVLEIIDLGPLLGVTKYEKEVGYTGSHDTSKRNGDGEFPEFPTHYIHITDEDNLQTKSKVLKELVGVQCDITVKQDGSSMTLIWDNEKFYVCSRRIGLYKVVGEEIEYDYSSPMVSFIKDRDLRNLFRGQQIVFQGEFCGPKINGNKLMLKRFEWYIFTVFEFTTIDSTDGRALGTYLSRDEFMERYYSQLWYGDTIKYVPLFDRMVPTEETTVASFKNLASMVRYIDPNGTKEVLGEGIVVRPTIPFRSRYLAKNCSFKIVNKNYKD